MGKYTVEKALIEVMLHACLAQRCWNSWRWDPSESLPMWRVAVRLKCTDPTKGFVCLTLLFTAYYSVQTVDRHVCVNACVYGECEGWLAERLPWFTGKGFVWRTQLIGTDCSEWEWQTAAFSDVTACLYAWSSGRETYQFVGQRFRNHFTTHVCKRLGHKYIFDLLCLSVYSPQTARILCCTLAIG